jgi:hypothetical protein
VSCGRGRPAGDRGRENVEHVGAEPDYFGSLAGTYVPERCELPLA